MSAPINHASPSALNPPRSRVTALASVPHCSRAPFPEIGDEVLFKRTPLHEDETGFVYGRIYGVCAIEIIDMNGKSLRLEAGQYKITHRMSRPEPVRHPPIGGWRAASGEPDIFECPERPKCGCPRGAMRADCPGLKNAGIEN